jgi:hypothetical protein
VSHPHAYAAPDELRHEGATVEAWWFWGHAADASVGVFVGIELRGSTFDYWAGLVRAGSPYLYIEELAGVGLRQGLEIKPPEMWADHQCDAPMQQWSLGNEAHGVLLDDPTEAWRRGYGIPVPVTFDLEWYAAAAPISIDGGYEQAGEIDARIELTEGVLAFTGPAHRCHVWNVPYLPNSFAMPVVGEGLRAPYRRSDGVTVDQVLTSTGWLGRAQSAAYR